MNSNPAALRPRPRLIQSTKAAALARAAAEPLSGFFWALRPFMFLAVTLIPTAGETGTNDPAVAAICRGAAAQVARESGVPLGVLLAISLTETGRTQGGAFDPWPWTVNMEGKGVWFPTRQEAQTYVDRHFARGARSFDVGCFQINYRWHGRAFSSVEEMFDPLANARYAARFLGELHEEFGDWSRAAGAYHSRTPKFANRYRARFDRIRSRLGRPEESPATELALAEPPIGSRAPTRQAVPRPNLFPLLQARSGDRSPGSLVPLGETPVGGRRLFGGPERG